MQPRKSNLFLSPNARWLAILFVLCCWSAVHATDKPSKILLRESFASSHRTELTEQLRSITGCSDFQLDGSGDLCIHNNRADAGSKLARTLLMTAATGKDIIVLEDTSNSIDIVFCRVIPARWTREREANPSAYVLQIDFSDFHQLLGDAPARQAFNVGWGVLHELDHIVNDSADAVGLGDAGHCEDNINAMRRELNLPERLEYFFTFFPATNDENFKSRLVRLAFERRIGPNGKSKRYWLIWDAAVVGGATSRKELASIR
jgi:hypothetical protein